MMAARALTASRCFRSYTILVVRHLACDTPDGTPVVIIDKARCFEEIKWDFQTDFSRFQEADGDIGWRYHPYLQITRLGFTGQNVGRVDCREMRVALKANTDTEYRRVAP